MKCEFYIEDGAGHYCRLFPQMHIPKENRWHMFRRIICFGEKGNLHCRSITKGDYTTIREIDKQPKFIILENIKYGYKFFTDWNPLKDPTYGKKLYYILGYAYTIKEAQNKITRRLND